MSLPPPFPLSFRLFLLFFLFSSRVFSFVLACALFLFLLLLVYHCPLSFPIVLLLLLFRHNAFPPLVFILAFLVPFLFSQPFLHPIGSLINHSFFLFLASNSLYIIFCPSRSSFFRSLLSFSTFILLCYCFQFVLYSTSFSCTLYFYLFSYRLYRFSFYLVPQNWSVRAS